MAFDTKSLRDAFGAFLTGVTVVTAHDPAGQPIGFTANSFTSVSLDPPLLLVCLAKSSANYQTLTTAKGFAVNILSERQKDISNTFARPSDDRFAAVDWENGPFGSPVLAGVAAWFDCSMHQVIDAGDHAILIGRVEAFENAGMTGLGYARGGYFTSALSESRLLANVDGPLLLGVVADRDGEILLVEDGKGGWTLPFAEKSESEGYEALETHIAQEFGASLSKGLLHSVYEDTVNARHYVIYRAKLGDGALKSGRLFSLQALPTDDIADRAVRDLLGRFVQESMLGNFGVYFGNQEKGRIHAVCAKE